MVGAFGEANGGGCIQGGTAGGTGGGNVDANGQKVGGRGSSDGTGSLTAGENTWSAGINDFIL